MPCVLETYLLGDISGGLDQVQVSNTVCLDHLLTHSTRQVLKDGWTCGRRLPMATTLLSTTSPMVHQ